MKAVKTISAQKRVLAAVVVAYGVWLMAYGFASPAFAALSETTQTDLFLTSEVPGGPVNSADTSSATYSGFTNDPPTNSVLIEVGYGSDEHDYFMEVQYGRFVNLGGGQWGVQYTSTRTVQKCCGYNGNIIVLVPPANSFITRWQWNSSNTSGGAYGGSDSFPVPVCAHAKYVKYDPITYALNYGTEAESGNCSSRGYSVPSTLRGYLNGAWPGTGPSIRAPAGEFIVGIRQFRFGNDAVLRGGTMYYRTLSFSSLNARLVSDNIPTSFSASETKSLGTDGQPLKVRLQNSGSITWLSDQQQDVSQSGSCTADTNADGVNDCPLDSASIGTFCSVDRDYKSSKYKLQHTSGPFVISGDPVQYRNRVNIRCEVVATDTCSTQFGPGGVDCTQDQQICEQTSGCFDTNGQEIFGCTQLSCGGFIGIGDPCEFGQWQEGCGALWGPFDQSAQVVSQSGPTSIASGASVDFFILSMTAPSVSGNHTDTFQMQGSQFGSILTANSNVTSNVGTIQVNSKNAVTLQPISSSGSVSGPQTFNYSSVSSQTFSNAQQGNYNFLPTPGSAGSGYTLQNIEGRIDSFASAFKEGDMIGIARSFIGLIAKAYVTSSSCGSGGTNSSATCWLAGASSVTFDVAWSPLPAISVSPASLSFSTQQGTNPGNQTATISNNGSPGSTLNWNSSISYSSGSGWLSLSPALGNGIAQGGSQNISVIVTSASLGVGTYNATVTIDDQAGDFLIAPASFGVTLTVSAAPPTISLSPASFNFSGQQGGANPPSQTLQITNTGPAGSTLNWSGSDNATWLSLSPVSGSLGSGNTSNVTVSVNSAGLTSGGSPYLATITVTDAAATNNPQTRSVTLTLSPANNPPGVSSPSVTSPGSQPGSWCVNDNQWIISWVFNDPGDTQSAYEVQVATDSGFGNIVNQSGKAFSSSTQYTVSSGLQHNSTTYWYRVRVWDSIDQVSGWSVAQNFTTLNNPYPSVTPSGTTPPPPLSVPANSVVGFVSNAQCFNSAGATTPCSSWFWNFGDSVTATSENPAHTYDVSLVNTQVTVLHRATDAAGQFCESSELLDIGAAQPLPDWREVGPL